MGEVFFIDCIDFGKAVVDLNRLFCWSILLLLLLFLSVVVVVVVAVVVVVVVVMVG